MPKNILPCFFALLVISLFSTCRNATSMDIGTQPIPLKNVVVIVGDDHAAYALACYGNDLIRTPNLDRLASQGTLFSRAYANAPLCSASRQSILTGRYPHAAGVTLLRTSFPHEQVTLAEHLSDQGFATAVMGKTHFNNNGRHGFQKMVGRGDWQAKLKENPPQKVPEGLYYGPWKPFRDPATIWLNADALPLPYLDEDMEDTYYAKEAANYIGAQGEQPFLLWVAFHNPHSPFNFPAEYRGKYDPDEMPLPVVSAEDDRWIPEIFKDLSDEEKKGIISAYYTSVEHMDHNVGRILDALDASGKADSTLVIYIGDQGYLLGHHKRFEKHMMWEEAIRSPLIVRAGNRKPARQEIGALTEFVDLSPTILELTGQAPMASAQGVSFANVLAGAKDNFKSGVFSEFLADNKAMIRTDRWKYIYSTGLRDLGQGYATGNPPPGVTHRLYDLQNDPTESRDVAGKPALQDTLKSMQEEMLSLFANTHPLADSINQLPREQQLAAYCVPPDADADLSAR